VWLAGCAKKNKSRHGHIPSSVLDQLDHDFVRSHVEQHAIASMECFGEERIFLLISATCGCWLYW
jgi:capsule polysaccharide modification protein KpsS